MTPGSMDSTTRSHAGSRIALGTSVAIGALLVALPSSAQQAALDPSTSPADDPASRSSAGESAYRFDGRALYLGAGAGVVPQAGEAGLATRVMLVFPVATDWFAIEGGALGQLLAITDHHGERVEVSMGAINAGTRFSFASDATVRPYAAARFTHMHFFPDPFGQHGHNYGEANHEYHHRWGAGGALGFDAGLDGPQSRLRLGLEAEAIVVTGPGIDVIAQMVGTFGIGF